ncbi:MAG: amidohydrolase family protein [Candidatus Eisenbacteria bacterium]|uniref:Amidohydrolase family protein n=1 Tax=Eiseniibacteriota bacterium TaxID=2212470 RepID=A0A948S1E4_UNCEI|nr:amidohydrolase family protein [Candidatus Eisenbacteria bacterium]MBU1947697.1 amidohydrolase family protein [Candidatus Eisenbacteria bacterium]MBU2692059.1 amidohydrolase family protein [Candidatus Eisenbacteria bacterium]
MSSPARKPGRVNAHTHLYSGLASLGMPPPKKEPENFLEILEHVWWKLDGALDERGLLAAARYYVADALYAGTSTLIDHHESPNLIEGSLDLLADTCQMLGMRAVLCYGATERNGGRTEARRGLEESRRFIKENNRPLVRGVVGLHASFTVSDETIREAGDLCRDLGTVLHIHLAEDRADVEDARSRGYEGPLERLIQLGALPKGSILAHGVHLTAAQVRRTQEHGCWIVQNPRSNRGNRVGYPKALGNSDRTALGTDGYPARMDEEEEALFETGLPHEARELLEERLAGGYRLTAERFDDPDVEMKDAVYHEEGRVMSLFVDNRAVIECGRLHTADWEEIQFHARQEAERLWDRMDFL